MPSLILLPFSVFFVCCILQFWYLKKVRDALIDRHPATFLKMEKSSIFPMQGIWRFTRGNQYKELGDAGLNRHIRNLKRLITVAILAWGACAVSMFTADLKPSRLPISAANGVFYNDCCGKLTIKDGKISFLSQKYSYVVERDKRPYVLTDFYVGASSAGFILHRDKFLLKMYIDDESHPTSIDMMNEEDGNVFSFHRLNGS